LNQAGRKAVTNEPEPIEKYQQLAEALVRENQAEDDQIKPAILWHYTTTAGMKGILEGRYLMGTDASYFNDKSETQHGVRLLTEVVEEMRPGSIGSPQEMAFLEIVQRFGNPRSLELKVLATCFCEDGDLLSQWRGYGGGYALGFDSNFGLQHTKVESEVLSPGPGVTLLKVVYDDDLTKGKMREALRQFLIVIRGDAAGGMENDYLVRVASICSGLLNVYMLAAKHSGFAEENEWRVIGLVDEERAHEVLSLRVLGNNLIPYMEMRLRDPGRVDSPLPLRTATIGPTIDSARAMESLSILLAKTGHAGVAVRSSRIPLA
jgi:hypothetical protein